MVVRYAKEKDDVMRKTGERRAFFENDMFGPCIESPAEETMMAAWEAKTPAARRKGARKALSIDLDCLDAYNLLAIEAETHAESIALLREAVSIGDRLFAPILDDEEVHWWGFIGTRPYMRAMHNLGLALMGAGDDAEAIFARMLKLNPNDNQGIRCILADIYMESDRLDDLRGLLAGYPDDMMVETTMASLFVAMREGKPATVLKRMAPDIEKRNSFVLAHLAGKGKPEKMIEFSPYGVAIGSEAEAFDYAERSRPCWNKRKALMNAIRKHVESASGE